MSKKFCSLVIAVTMTIAFTTTSYGESLTPNLVKAKAKAAAALLKAEGQAALAKIRDENGEFRYAGGQGYVWIHNIDGLMVMHPIKPALEGKDLLGIGDANEFLLFVAMNQVAEDHGEGWVPYSWPKPDSKESTPKVSYVVLVDEYVVGSGINNVTLADIKAQFPNDAVYED